MSNCKQLAGAFQIFSWNSYTLIKDICTYSICDILVNIQSRMGRASRIADIAGNRFWRHQRCHQWPLPNVGGGGGSLTTQQQENTRKSQKCHANGLSNPCYPKLNSQHWDIQNNIVTINILFEKRRRWGALNPLYQEVPPIPALIWVQPRWHRINHILLHVVCHCRSSLAIVGHHW